MTQIYDPFHSVLIRDIDGYPLTDGYVYFGEAGLDAQTNPITVYSDLGLETAITQPLRTRDGFMVNSGRNETDVHVDGQDYSITILNEQGVVIKQSLSSTNEFYVQLVGGVKDATNLDGAIDVAVSGDYAYVLSFNDDSLRIINVSDPTAPVLIGGVKDSALLNGVWAIAVSGNYAYVTAETDDSLRIINVSDPTAPVLIGGVKDSALLNGAWGVVVSGHYAFVTCNDDASLRIIDISNVTAPTIIGGIKDAISLAGARGLAVSGNYAYVSCATDASLRVINVSDPTAPVLIGGVKDAISLAGARRVKLSGNYAYVTAETDDSLRIINVSDPTAPVLIGGVKDSNLDGARGLAVSGNYAYVTCVNDDSLRIIDISGLQPVGEAGAFIADSIACNGPISSRGSIHTTNGISCGQTGINSEGPISGELINTGRDNARLGAGLLDTTATDGFTYIPTCAGTPTGTPTTFTGFAPLVVDTTNDKLYIYSSGAWVDVSV